MDFFVLFFKLKDIVHDNLNAFVGASIDPPNIDLVWFYCHKGSLQVSDLLGHSSLMFENYHMHCYGQ